MQQQTAATPASARVRMHCPAERAAAEHRTMSQRR